MGQVAGIVAYIGLAFLVFFGDTARFWDKYIGLDKIIKFQKKFSYYVLTAILLHPIFFMASLGFKNISGFLIPDFGMFGLALGIIAFYIYLVVMIASYLYKRISYKVWQYIHIGTYVLVFGALTHAVLIGSDKNDYAAIYIISFILLIVGIIYRTAYKIRELKNNKFIVDSVVFETEDTFTLYLEKKDNFNYKAGQFSFIRIGGNKLYARHPFTMSSAPNDDKIAFTIKIAGKFTQIAKELKKGDTVTLDGPFGIFVSEMRSKKDKDLVFFAGGVGITPFLSIIKDAIYKNSNQKITLFYASRTINDIIFKKELDLIDKEWFKKIYFLSKEVVNEPGYENGYFSEELIKKYVPNIKDADCYVCGPTPMKNLLIPLLKGLGVRNIIKEDFFW